MALNIKTEVASSQFFLSRFSHSVESSDAVFTVKSRGVTVAMCIVLNCILHGGLVDISALIYSYLCPYVITATFHLTLIFLVSKYHAYRTTLPSMFFAVPTMHRKSSA